MAHESKHKTSVLIAGRPCRMRDSLYFLLKTMPGIEVIGHADNSVSAIEMVSELHPVLALLDTNLPNGGAVTIVRQIKTNGTPNRCLVLAGDTQQKQEATEAGADAALLKGCSAAEIFQAIQELLAETHRTTR